MRRAADQDRHKREDAAARVEQAEREAEERRRKAGRVDALSNLKTLLGETVRSLDVRWEEARPRLFKDPQGRASHEMISSEDVEKAFRWGHVLRLISSHRLPQA